MRIGLRVATGQETLQLLLGGAPGDDQTVELFFKAGLDEQGGFNEDNVSVAAALPLGEFLQHSGMDARVNDGVEAGEFCGIGEDDRGQLRAVDAFTVRGDLAAEFCDSFSIGRLPWFDQLMSEGVGVKHCEALVAQYVGDGTFAAGDSAGETKFQHAGAISRRWWNLRRPRRRHWHFRRGAIRVAERRDEVWQPSRCCS